MNIMPNIKNINLREGKRLILVINEFFKSTNEKSLMDLMKAITVKKKKIEVRLNGK